MNVLVPCPDSSLFPWGKRLGYICHTADSCWRNALRSALARKPPRMPGRGCLPSGVQVQECELVAGFSVVTGGGTEGVRTDQIQEAVVVVVAAQLAVSPLTRHGKRAPDTSPLLLLLLPRSSHARARAEREEPVREVFKCFHTRDQHVGKSSFDVRPWKSPCEARVRRKTQPAHSGFWKSRSGLIRAWCASSPHLRSHRKLVHSFVCVAGVFLFEGGGGLYQCSDLKSHFYTSATFTARPRGRQCSCVWLGWHLLDKGMYWIPPVYLWKDCKFIFFLQSFKLLWTFLPNSKLNRHWNEMAAIHAGMQI